MGQSQLIVIVLGVLVVGLAVYTGVLMVHSNGQSNDEEQLKQQMNIVVTEAMKYASKLRSMGGGEGSFTGFQPQNNILNTNQVHIEISISNNTIIFQAYGTVTGLDGTTPVSLVGVYDGTSKSWQSLTRTN